MHCETQRTNPMQIRDRQRTNRAKLTPLNTLELKLQTKYVHTNREIYVIYQCLVVYEREKDREIFPRNKNRH